MYQIKNFLENDDIRVVEEKGNIKIVEYLRDLSVNPATAMTQYYAAKMNVRKRQALIEVKGDEYITSAGAMQWMLGNLQSVTDVKGVGCGKVFAFIFLLNGLHSHVLNTF